jgi:hypothetical protein
MGGGGRKERWEALKEHMIAVLSIHDSDVESCNELLLQI